MLTIPAAFAETIVRLADQRGRAWLATLPQLIEQLCASWRLTPDGAPLHGGLGLVLPVRRAGEALVLKVSWPHAATAQEVAALSAWNGHGAVRLVAADPDHDALLLERLDPRRTLGTAALPEALRVTGRLLRRLAVAAPPGVPSLSEWAATLAAELPQRWAEQGRPFPARLLDHARELCLDLGPTADRLLIHGDLHPDNVLAGTREPWLAIDPKPIAGDVEYGLAPFLWRRLDEVPNRRAARRTMQTLCEQADLRPERAHGWTLVRSLDYWLWGLGVGLTYDPARCERLSGWLTS